MNGNLLDVATKLVRLFGSQFNHTYAMEARQALLEWSGTISHFSFVDDIDELLEKVKRWAKNPPASPTLDLRLGYQVFNNMGTVTFSFRGHMLLGQASMWVSGDTFLTTYMDALSLERGQVMTFDPLNRLVNGTNWDSLTPLQQLGYVLIDAFGHRNDEMYIRAAGDVFRGWMDSFQVLHLNGRRDHFRLVQEWVHHPPRTGVFEVNMLVDGRPVIFRMSFAGDMVPGSTTCSLTNEYAHMTSSQELLDFIAHMGQEVGPVEIPLVV